MAGLRAVLQRDESLWELLNTPLMLRTAALAYQGRTADEIHPSGSVEAHRTHLFAAYTDAMFRRGAPTTPDARKQTEHWLTWLAKAMQDHGQTVFYLERLQPDWLPVQRQQRLVTFITSVMSGLLFGLPFGLPISIRVSAEEISELLIADLSGPRPGRLLHILLFGLLGGLSVGIRNPLVGVLLGGLSHGLFGGLLGRLFSGLFGGLLGGLSVMLVGYSKEIIPVEKVRWSWSAARYKWLDKLSNRLFLGLLFGLPLGLLFTPHYGLLLALQGGLVLGLPFGLLFGLFGALKDGFIVGELKTQSFPNEGIRRSVLNGSIRGLLGWLFGGLLIGLPVGLGAGLFGGLISGLLVGLLIGLLVGLRFGGRACLQHCALRLILWYNNFAPLHYIRFLDYAAARIFLYKVGGGYVFVHRMLLEYFAAMPQASTKQQSCNTHG